MKKVIVVLLVAAIAASAVFAGVSIDARFLGLSAEYGVSYDFGKVRGGVEMSTLSVGYIAYLALNMNKNGQSANIPDMVREYSYFLYRPTAVGLYCEYDLSNIDSVEFGLGLGVTALIPGGMIEASNGGQTGFTMVNPTLSLDLGVNVTEHDAVTARLVFPFTLCEFSGGYARYLGAVSVLLATSVGYRHSF